MSLSSFIFGLILLITVGNLCVNARRFGKKGRYYVSPKQRPASLHARHIAFLKRPSVVCHCSYRKYLKLKSRNLLRRGVVFKLNHGKKLEKKSNSPGVIYAPLCCNIDLSNPNKLYRYPMTIRLTEKVFTEKYKDTESAEFQELSNELTNSINQLVSDASSLINVEVSGFRPGSVIVDLILTTKGIFPQELYDTLKFAIESGQLGNLKVALVPESKPPTQEGSEQTGTKPGESTETTPEGAGTNVITPNESAGTDTTTTTGTDTTTTTGTKPGDTDVITPTDTDTTGTLPESKPPTQEGSKQTGTKPEGAGTNVITPNESAGTDTTGTKPGDTGTDVITPTNTDTTGNLPESKPPTQEGSEQTGTKPEESTGITPEGAGTNVITPNESAGTDTTTTTGTKPADTGTDIITPTDTDTTSNLPGESTGTTSTTPDSTGNTATSTTDTGDAYQNECVCAHNQKRKAHGTTPLIWSAEIAASAQEFANELAAADSVNIKHGKSGYGENLYVAYGTAPLPKDRKGTCVKAVDEWYDEIAEYDFNNPGFNSKTGHFTQVVWKTTAQFGVGEALTSTNKRFVVARYKPAGNMMGEFEQNVPRPLTGSPAPASTECINAAGTTPTDTETGPGTGALNPTPKVPEDTDILTGPTATPNPLTTGETGSVTLNPLTGATLSPPSPSGNVGETPNTLSGGETGPGTPKPTLNPLTGATLSPPTPSGNVGVTPNTLSGGLTESPKPTLNPLTGATLSPPTSENVGVTPNPLSPSVTPNPISPSVMPSATKPSEPTDARPNKPYDPSTPAKLIKAVIGLVGQVFTAALSNPATEEYQKAKNAIEQAIMSVFDIIPSFRSVSLTGFRPGGSKRKRKLSHAKRSSSASNTVNAEVELEFTEAKPNQLAPLEEEVADGKLNNIKVQPQISAAIITEDIPNHCPPTCMPTNMCRPQCPIQCCTPPTTNTCQQACPSACAPGCTTTCCSLGSSAHLVKKSTKLTKS